MLERGRAKTSRRDLIASGCHDPSGTLYLLHPVRLIVSYQSIILRRTSRRLRCSSLFTSQRSQPACSLFAPTPPVTHASLPPALPLAPHASIHYTTLHYTTLHCTVQHCSLAQNPWVLRLATTSSSGRSRAFRQIIGANLLLENGAITCPLTSAPPPPYTSIAPPTPRFSPDTRFLTHCATTTRSAHRLDTLVLCISSFYPPAFAHSLRLDFFPAPAIVREQLPYTRHHHHTPWPCRRTRTAAPSVP